MKAIASFLFVLKNERKHFIMKRKRLFSVYQDTPLWHESLREMRKEQ